MDDSKEKRPSYMIDDPIERAKRWIEEEQERRELSAQNDEICQALDEMRSNNTDTNESSGGRTFSAQEIASEYGMSAKKLNKLLHDRGIQYKRNNHWCLYRYYEGRGFVSYESKHGHMRWTQEGREFLHKVLSDLQEDITQLTF